MGMEKKFLLALHFNTRKANITPPPFERKCKKKSFCWDEMRSSFSWLKRQYYMTLRRGRSTQKRFNNPCRIVAPRKKDSWEEGSSSSSPFLAHVKAIVYEESTWKEWMKWEWKETTMKTTISFPRPWRLCVVVAKIAWMGGIISAITGILHFVHKLHKKIKQKDAWMD